MKTYYWVIGRLLRIPGTVLNTNKDNESSEAELSLNIAKY